MQHIVRYAGRVSPDRSSKARPLRYRGAERESQRANVPSLATTISGGAHTEDGEWMKKTVIRTHEICLWLCSATLGMPLSARDLYVNSIVGDDHADGVVKPVKSIKRALLLAQPADTVNLAPQSSPYYERVWVQDKSGEPGKAIIIDGHGSTIEGCAALNPEHGPKWAPAYFEAHIYTRRSATTTKRTRDSSSFYSMER